MWYKKAAEKGSNVACVKIGDCYCSGWGTGTASYTTAAEWYLKAAGEDNPEAQFKLAELCRAHPSYVCQYIYREDYSNSGEWPIIFELYTSAAEQGHVGAQIALGDWLTSEESTASKGEAVEWYSKAANQGNAVAQWKLGDCYINGLVKTSNRIEMSNGYRNKEALRLYRKSANQGNAEAMERLADCYTEGKGVAQNELEAARWRRKAERLGAVLDYEL